MKCSRNDLQLIDVGVVFHVRYIMTYVSIFELSLTISSVVLQKEYIKSKKILALIPKFIRAHVISAICSM